MSKIKSIELKPDKIEILKNSDPSALNQKDYKAWFNWWSQHFTSEDYWKFLATQVKYIFII